MKHPIELGSVQETLLLTLYSRAALTKKNIGGLQDETALHLVESIDYDFSAFDKSKSLIAPALRTAVLDRWVRQFLREHPDGTVVELGAGLNSRFERVDNGRVRWFDIDLDDSMRLRRKFFSDSDRRKLITGSITEETWVSAVQQTGGPYFLIAEGVYPYLEAEQVRGSVRTLSKHFPGSRYTFDTIAPWVIGQQTDTDLIRHLNGQLRWGVNDPAELGEWGLKLVESLNYTQIPKDLDPPLVPRVRNALKFVGVIAGLVRAKVVESSRINLFELTR